MSDDTQELRELLGSGDDAAAGVAGAVIASAPPEPPSPTVLATDRWTRRAGERLATQWHDVLTQDADAEGLAQMDTMCDPNVAADAIETLLSASPRLAARPEDEHRAKWWKQVMIAPETVALRARTIASAPVAEIAAAEIARSYAEYVAANPAPEPNEQGQDGDGDGEGDENESPEQSVARMRSARSALKAASEAADMAEAVGAGLGAGTGGQMDSSTLAKYTRRLRQSTNLAAIMRMAGRFIAKAERLQRQRTNLPGMEITGVELSNDLARVLPFEAAQIAGVVPELETLALLRLAESRSLSYRRIRREPVAMGPIVVSVDESGSMQGDRIAAAKGLALAMASIARAQKRPFMLVGWSSEYEGGVNIARDTDGPEAVVEWLEHFYCGGTDLHGPLFAVTDQWPEGKVGAHADHIIITDGDVGMPSWLRDHYLAWAKGTNVRTFGLGVGVRSLNALGEVCDGGVWTMPELDLNNPAVDVVLSIGPTYK